MTDTEKKIAEIREALEVIKRYDLSTLDNIMMPVYNFCVNAPEWLRFLLSELDRRDEENRKLREENEGRKKIIEAYMRIEHDLAEDAERYFDQRNRLIECLRFYERLARGREVNDGGRRARTLLAEIGVTVE